MKLRFRIGVDSNQNAYEELEAHLKWRKQNLPPIVTSWTEVLLNSGFLYIHGRDRKFRPALIIEPRRLENSGIPKDKLSDSVISCTSFVIEYMMKNVLLKG